MFGYTNFVTNPNQATQKPSRVQASSIVRHRTNTATRSYSPSAPRNASNQSHVQSSCIPVAERNTTRQEVRTPRATYNQQRSPMGKVQKYVLRDERPSTPIVDRRISGNMLRSRIQKDVSPVSVSRSDVIKHRRLEEECMERVTRPQSCDEKSRLKTSEYLRVENKASECHSLEDKVLLAVKEVLSRAVIERGKIDGNDIGTILQDMKSRLKKDESIETDNRRGDIVVEMKKSKTKMSITPSAENMSFKRAKPLAGIIRKDLSDMSNRRGQRQYKRFYTRTEPLATNNEESKKTLEDEPDTVVYIDLPDSDYSNFTSILRKNEEKATDARRKKENEIQIMINKNGNKNKPSEGNLSRKDSRNPTKNICTEEVVGDYHSKDQSEDFNFWKSTEDAKLQNYIESLIRNMNLQLNSKQPCQEIEDEVDCKQTVCKSFCVCKVCVSKTASSKATLPKENSKHEVKEVKGSDFRIKNTAKSTSNVSQNVLAARGSRLSNRDSNPDPVFKVLKRNQNFQPESRVNIVPGTIEGHNTINSSNSKAYLTTVSRGAPEECSEDMYLKRRFSRNAVKRGVSTRM